MVARDEQAGFIRQAIDEAAGMLKLLPLCSLRKITTYDDGISFEGGGNVLQSFSRLGHIIRPEV